MSVLEKVKTNDLKKGTNVVLRNGWSAILMDNRRGNLRCAKVFGLYTEMGDIYGHDIARAEVDGVWYDIDYTDQQKKRSLVGDPLIWWGNSK